MPTICALIEYDGTNYCGWQVQPNGPSIQAALEEALFKLTGERERFRGAGRTDAGVHARGQVAAFRTDTIIPPENFAAALNSRLPKDISVRATHPVADDFDPRRHAKRKLYRYAITCGPTRPAIDRCTRWYVKGELDTAAMVRAARQFEGTHDYTAFSNQECNAEGANNVRTVDRCEIVADGFDLTVDVEGRSFLYNMIRNIVGMLVDVGQGRFAPADIPAVFAARDRQQAGRGAPAHGLCLEWIRYE